MSSRYSSGEIQSAYSSSALRNLDQSPPMVGTMSKYVTPNMMATENSHHHNSRYNSRARPKSLKSTTFHSSVYQHTNQPSKADQSLNWRRADEKSRSAAVIPFTKQQAPLSKFNAIDEPSDQVAPKQQEDRLLAVDPQAVAQSSMTRSTSLSGLTAALLLQRRVSGSPSQTQALSNSISQAIEETIAQPVSQVQIDTTQELLGRAGDSASNAAFVVRSKINGQLSIFKPADGETTKEMIQAKRLITQLSSSVSSQSEPESPSSPEDAIVLRSSISELTKTPVKKGVTYGETALKEAAAFMLDQSGFSGVPPTRVTKLLVPRDVSRMPVIDPTSIVEKPVSQDSLDVIDVPRSAAISIGSSSGSETGSGSEATQGTEELVARFGSLSAFVPHFSSADEMGSSMFSLEDVQRIGILDIRMLNLDRHLGNILVSEDKSSNAESSDSSRKPSKYRLHPIDHGYSLPSYKALSDVRFEWTNWRQSAQPFTAKSLAFIESLDPVKDCLKLTSLGIQTESLVSLVFATLLLQKGAAAGLTLRDIANMCQRQLKDFSSDYDDDDDDAISEPSPLEKIVSRVMDTYPGGNDAAEVQVISSPTVRSCASPTEPFASPLSCDSAGSSLSITRSQSSIDPSSQSLACVSKPTPSITFDLSVGRLLCKMTDVIDEELKNYKSRMESGSGAGAMVRS